MSQPRLSYVFRRPRYPILCAVPGDLIVAHSRGQLERRLSKVQLPPDDILHMIDATGEGWGLYTQLMAVSPLVLKKRWTKAEILQLFRASATGKRIGNPREDKLLLRQRLDALILMVADLVEQGRRPNKPSEPARTLARSADSPTAAQRHTVRRLSS